MFNKFKEAANALKNDAIEAAKEKTQDAKNFASETAESAKQKYESLREPDSERYIVTLPNGVTHSNCTIADIKDLCWKYNILIEGEE